MLLPLSESYSPEDPSCSRIQTFVPPDLTGQIKKLDNQYCAAGSFGDVYRCQYHSEFGVKEVAVKTLRFEFTVEEEDIVDGRSNRMRRRELGIWKRLSHPNIVPFLGTVSGFGRLGNASLVSSWMPNGTLQDFLLKYASDDELTVAHRLHFLLGVANGLQYLHSLSIVHGDLTCNNILLDEKCNARLTDFGYASLVGEIPEALHYLQASTLRPGAVRWAAPEYFSSNPEEMFHCTTKSDIYSFGNIALQVLSGELPWSEFRRDAVVVLHLAKGDKPRRPQSHPINDQHWEFIEHCWSSVQERPSAEHLVLSVLHFARSYPHSQPLCGLLVSSEKSEPQSTLSRPLLPDIDQLSSVEALSPPRTLRYSPQPTPDSNSSSLLRPRKSRTRNDPGDGCGSEATSQASRAQSTLGGDSQNGQAVDPTETAFPQRPPPVHSKSNVAFPPFLNTSSIGQDQPNILYPFPQEHHQRIQGTTTSGRGNRGATSASRDGGDGFWSFLSSGFGAIARKRSISSISGADISPLRERVLIRKVQLQQLQPEPSPSVTAHQSSSHFSNANRSTIKPHSFSSSSMLADFIPYDDVSYSLPTCNPLAAIIPDDDISVPYSLPTYNPLADIIPDDDISVPYSLPTYNPLADIIPDDDISVPYSLPTYNPLPQETVPSIRDHSRSPSSRSHGRGDGPWRALSSNRPSPYPRQLASVRHESPPNSALTDQQLSMPRPDLSRQAEAEANRRTVGASRLRRKQDANFSCPAPGCGSTFTTSLNLKNHMRRSHDKDWPFQCKWPGCGRGFVRQHSCRYHEQFHCKSRPFTCEGCNKIFPRMSALNRHLRTTSGAECKRILDASEVSEGLLVPKTEEQGWPSMRGLTPDHVGPSLLPQVTSNADIIRCTSR